MSNRHLNRADVKALVTRYLPIYHLHLLEEFGPMSIDEYVRQCILWKDKDTDKWLGDDFKKVTLVLPGNITISDPDYGDLTPEMWKNIFSQLSSQGNRSLFLDFAGWSDADDWIAPYEECNPAEARKKYGPIKKRKTFETYAHVAPGSIYANTGSPIQRLQSWRDAGWIAPKVAKNLEQSIRNIYDRFVVLSFSPFYCMQDWRDKGGWDNHESDFEDGSLTLVIDIDQLEARYVSFSRHGGSNSFDRDIRVWSEWLADKTGLKVVKRNNDHVHAYIALGGHGTYPEAGYFDRQPGEETAMEVLASIPVVNLVVAVLVCIVWLISKLFGGDPADLFNMPNNDDARGGGITIGEGGTPWKVDAVADRYNHSLPPWWDEYNGFWGIKVRNTVWERNISGSRFADMQRLPGQLAIDDAVDSEIQVDEVLSRQIAEALVS